MLDFAHARQFGQRSKKYWVAALCATSFACGNYLFGDDSDESESLLSQYQQATQQLVTEVPPQIARQSGSATNSTSHSSRLQPAKAQAASIASPGQTAVSNTPVPQQKSSRRVKPTQQQSPESSVANADLPTKVEAPPQPEPSAKTESLAQADTPTIAEPAATEEPTVREQAAEHKPVLAQQAPAAPTAPEPPPAAAPVENKPLPKVTYIPPQSAVTQKQLAPRMEIITPAATETESPRAQDQAAQNSQFAANRSVPTHSEAQPIAQPQVSQPLPQIINISRPAVAPPPPPKLASTLAELNDENLPPIVSPDQVRRPGTRKKPIQPAAQSTPVLRIDLSKK
jgi:hypothetical protein